MKGRRICLLLERLQVPGGYSEILTFVESESESLVYPIRLYVRGEDADKAVRDNGQKPEHHK